MSDTVTLDTVAGTTEADMVIAITVATTVTATAADTAHTTVATTTTTEAVTVVVTAADTTARVQDVATQRLVDAEHGMLAFVTLDLQFNATATRTLHQATQAILHEHNQAVDADLAVLPKVTLPLTDPRQATPTERFTKSKCQSPPVRDVVAGRNS